MEGNIPKKPNLGNKLPAGHELRWNPETQRWAIYPIPGYSQMYLSRDKNHFVPKKNNEAKNLSSETSKSNNGEKIGSHLQKAKTEKNDEFYTRLDDISAELKHYKSHFKDKVVYCPCDKVYKEGQSNFFVYFATFFEELGLKSLICTQYNPNPGEHGIKWVYNGGLSPEDVLDESKHETVFLKGDGDFLSEECRQITKESDIVVSNFPFSLFRPFVAQVLELNKKLLVIGNKNAITFKEIFPLIRENKLWLGYTVPEGFDQPEGDEKKNLKGLTRWFTNLTHSKRKEGVDLVMKYEGREDKYPVYDNYDAIEIGHYTKTGKWEGSVNEIPYDYDGIMGVPITFLDCYSPEQFEIIGCTSAVGIAGVQARYPSDSFMNLVNAGKVRTGGTPGRAKPCFIDNQGYANVGYHRVLIRRKK